MTSPDQIRADIERTRSNLSDDVNALTDSVKPSKRGAPPGRQGAGRSDLDEGPRHGCGRQRWRQDECRGLVRVGCGQWDA